MLLTPDHSVSRPHLDSVPAQSHVDSLAEPSPQFQIYRKLGAHLIGSDADRGVQFSVWAPNAQQVSVVGDFNQWQPGMHVADVDSQTGVWTIQIPNATENQRYKFHIVGPDGRGRDKCDPVGFAAETPPATASRIVRLDGFQWNDHAWMAERTTRDWTQEPISAYELHLGSWRHDSRHSWGWPNYRDIVHPLVDHLHRHGFTHVELLPISEHPLTQSWGYQTVGYFAVTSRYGTPDDFRYFVDVCHQNGIAVIVDWVPAHFPKDDHGLARFDGTCLYEHPDPRLGEHPDWGTLIFNYSDSRVVEFLVSSALFWLDMYHVDALRVDAVSSMLYRDYSRQPGAWLPNEFGGNENLEAMDLLRTFNSQVHQHFPGAITIAEESTAWPGVTRPAQDGGLGFDFKWNMGWMNDSLKYFREEPHHRPQHHDTLTFSLSYTNAERYCLPLSHDEVVHGKGSLISKMPGDEFSQFANLRLLYAWMWTHPGKKLLFMGGELAAWREWNCDDELDWSLWEQDRHAGISRLVQDLNRIYRAEAALHRGDHSPDGFQWIEGGDRQNGVLSFLRQCPQTYQPVVVVGNFCHQTLHEYRVGVPRGGAWHEVLNTDSRFYGGLDVGNQGALQAADDPWHGRPHSLTLTLPPLAAIVLKPA